MTQANKLLGKLEKFKYPALVLLIGLALLLFPGGGRADQTKEDTVHTLEELLSNTEGVGSAMVLVSDNGVVVVCSGAENPGTRLDIIRAVGSYTGFGSDKITVLKMSKER